jgi:HD-GYP domain-containing protein (c-di-GMP phosphodiesterase class II)
MDDVLPGVLHHHEKWNGQGYPHGLAGEAIPLIARVLALADTFDAMCSSRSYRKAIPREQVLAEIRRCAGSQFEPRLAEAFVKLDFQEFDRLLGTEQPESLAAA